MSFLRRHRCAEMQGHYFSKPVSTDEATSILKSDESFGDIGVADAVVKSFWPTSEGYSGLPLER